jgi:putative transposase
VDQINYHLVRIPRYRKKVLTGSVHKRLKEIFGEIAAELDFENLALEILGDHVHVVMSAPLQRTQSSADDEKVYPLAKSVLGATR